jgi:hypothetical protein
MQKWLFDDENGILYNLAGKSKIIFDIIHKRTKGVEEDYEFAIFWVNADDTKDVIYFDLFGGFICILKKFKEELGYDENEFLELDNYTKMLLIEDVAREFVDEKILSFFEINHMIKKRMLIPH